MKQFFLTTILLIILMSNYCFAQQKRAATSTQHSANSVPANPNPGPNPGDLGKVTFVYSGKEVTYVTVRAADGNIWLQQNLGSDHPAEADNDKYAFGDLFQWGRWDDSHQSVSDENTSHMTLQPNNPSGLNKNGKNPFYFFVPGSWWILGQNTDQWQAASPADVTATNGCDPCKALGTGWRLPTKDEMQKMVDAEHINNYSSAFHANLKLVGWDSRDWATGYCSKYVAHGGGMFWTSTAYDGSNGFAFASNRGVIDGYNRGYGFSVRCLLATK